MTCRTLDSDMSLCYDGSANQGKPESEMRQLTAYYSSRHGGSGGRSISTISELEAILKGAHGVKTVRVVTASGEECGWREQREDGKWYWCYDQDMVRGLPA